MQLQAVFEYVILEELDHKDRMSAKGIYTGDKKKSETGKGRVVSVGSECKGLEENDIVYFNKYAPHEIEIDGKPYLTFPYKEVMCKEIA